MTLSEYIAEVYDRIAEDPGKRTGQQMFVVLWQHRPDLANFINGTSLDPFYMDAALDSARIDEFLAWLGTRLEVTS